MRGQTHTHTSTHWGIKTGQRCFATKKKNEGKKDNSTGKKKKQQFNETAEG